MQTEFNWTQKIKKVPKIGILFGTVQKCAVLNICDAVRRHGKLIWNGDCAGGDGQLGRPEEVWAKVSHRAAGGKGIHILVSFPKTGHWSMSHFGKANFHIYEPPSYKVSSGSQFEYAWCLVRSRYPADIRKGIILLEDLLKNREETNKRDYLYYLSIGNTRLKEYATALRFIRALLQLEPGNRQAQVDHHLTII